MNAEVLGELAALPKPRNTRSLATVGCTLAGCCFLSALRDIESVCLATVGSPAATGTRERLGTEALIDSATAGAIGVPTNGGEVGCGARCGRGHRSNRDFAALVSDPATGSAAVSARQNVLRQRGAHR